MEIVCPTTMWNFFLCYPVQRFMYFELSSNRRDIWRGSDMKGEASDRAEWNRVVITDAIVPSYTNLLLHSRSIFTNYQ